MARSFDREHIQKLMVHSQKSAQKRLDQICEKYLEGCPLYIKHVATGDPAREILRFIEEEKIDMVVMTSRGEKGHFDFGSVSEKVVKHSKAPVMIVPLQDGLPSQKPA